MHTTICRSGVDLPEVARGLDAIPAGRHPYVDKGHGIGPAFRPGALHHLETVPTLISRVQLEFDGVALVGGRAKQRLLHGVAGGCPASAGQNFAEIIVDRTVVVDHEDTAIFFNQRIWQGVDFQAEQAIQG